MSSYNPLTDKQRMMLEQDYIAHANAQIYKRARIEGIPITKEYDRAFLECSTYSEWWAYYLTTQHRTLSIRPEIDHGNICELHIATILHAEWHPSFGSDVRKIVDYEHSSGIARIEVRHTHMSGGDSGWFVDITDSNGEKRADFVVINILPDDLNPCYGLLFCFPQEYLISNFKGEKIRINKKSWDTYRKKENKHWGYRQEYWNLENYIIEYCNWGEADFGNYDEFDPTQSEPEYEQMSFGLV